MPPSHDADEPDRTRSEGASDRVALGRALRLVRAFYDLNPTMPMGAARAFLQVAAEPGLTLGELAKRSGVAPSSATRYVQYLGKQDRHGLLGMMLVAKHRHGRKVRIDLTPAGEELLSELHAAIGGHQRQ